MPLPVSAAVPAEITWAYIEEKADCAVLHFETPVYLQGAVDSYEFAAAGTDWMTVSTSEGGSLTLNTGGYVRLRCKGADAYSAEKSFYVSFGEMFGMADSFSGVSCVYRASDSFPQNAYLSAQNITSGKVYESVRMAVPASRPFRLYDVYFLYGNGQTFSADSEPILRLPLDSVFLRGHCRAYYINEQNHTTQELTVSYDRTSVSFRSKGPGLYYIVSYAAQDSEAVAAEPPGVGKVFNFYGRRLLSGDADENAVIDAADARLTLRAAVGLEELRVLSAECADTDWDGVITAADARQILRHSVGLV